MKQYTQEKDFCTENCETRSLLEQIARKGAQKMLQQALELEVEEYIQAHTKDTNSSGRKTVLKAIINSIASAGENSRVIFY
jgi:hypothetical protein